MDFRVKTTLEIPDHLMRQLKERAARDGKTMSELVEGALRTLLEHKAEARELPPLPTFKSGGFLVNIDNRAEWYDQLDDADEADDVRR
jgi:hypothetical protein